jgi:hypothetical protein
MMFPEAEGLITTLVRINEWAAAQDRTPVEHPEARLGVRDHQRDKELGPNKFLKERPKDWKTIVRPVGANADHYRASFRQKDINLSDWANGILDRIDFACEPSRIAIARVTVAELGFKHATPRKVIYQRALSLGLEKLPAWVPMEVRAIYDTQPAGEWLVAATDPIPCSDDAHPELLGIGRYRNGKACLGGTWGYDGHEWFPGALFLFGISRD